MDIQSYVDQAFGTVEGLFRLQVALHGEKPAILCEGRSITYRGLEGRAARIAAALQRDGVHPRGCLAICALNSIDYAALMLGALRAGVTVAPLAPSATPEQIADMVRDCSASHLALDAQVTDHLGAVLPGLAVTCLAMEPGALGQRLDDWMAPEGSAPEPVEISPDQPFNIIYSSGTTGTPKGIVQSHAMRWPHVHRTDPPGYGPDAVTILSTPLYSNTTLVSFIPTLAGGGTAVLMRKFDARRFLELSQAHRVTHAMLVPVQYRRILDVPDFDDFDLSSYRLKFATSAPFAAELKREVLERWPGGLIEYYGMTEGGGSCVLIAHQHPDKLHTVGVPIPGHEVRVIDGAGNELPPGEVGELVGRSPSIMTGYHNRPDKTREAEWISPQGERFIRTGDLGLIDEDGFIVLMGRRKDMIISGGFNIYAVDLEEVLLSHPSVRDAAVIGVASPEWGETPVAFVVTEPEAALTGEDLKAWANERLNRMQRLAQVIIVDELPRSAIGKILKRDLLARYDSGQD